MQETIPVIYIVTPSFNSEKTIDQTILSVVTQAGNFKIRYHVQDGASSDKTVEILKKWKSRIDTGTLPVFCKGVTFTFESAPDKGMYDAIVRGFGKFFMRPSDFMSWINADDIYQPGALALVADVGSKYSAEQISWIGGGVSIIRNDKLISHGERPAPTSVIRDGLCDGQHWYFVQQEGSFFRNFLWVMADGASALKGYKLAGDWNLWRVFAQQAELYEVPYPLGSFRLREGQISANKDEYMAEVNATVPLQSRRLALERLGQERGGPARYMLKVKYPSGELYVVKKTGTWALFHHYQKVFGDSPPIARENGEEVEVMNSPARQLG